MLCRVYTISIDQDGRSYQREVVLPSGVVCTALGQKTAFGRAMAKVLEVHRRIRNLPVPGYREPHSTKQFVLNQFNLAVLNSQEYHDLMQEIADRKAEAMSARHPKGIVIPRAFTPIEPYQFNRLRISAGRLASLREHAQYLTLGLFGGSAALTPRS